MSDANESAGPTAPPRRRGRPEGHRPARGRGSRLRRWLATAAALAAAGAASGGPGAPLARTAEREPWQTELIELVGTSPVREAFNADVGRTRLLLTFSPT